MGIENITQKHLKIFAGGYGSDQGSGNDNIVIQEDTIFVSGMDVGITEEEICQHFGAIGLIKVRILINYIIHILINLNN